VTGLLSAILYTPHLLVYNVWNNGVRAGKGCFAGFSGWAPNTLARFRQTCIHIHYIHGLSLSAAGHDRCRNRARLADLLGIFGRCFALLPAGLWRRAAKRGGSRVLWASLYILTGKQTISILDILGGHRPALVNSTATTQREKNTVTLPACAWYGTKMQDLHCRTLRSRPSHLELTARGWHWLESGGPLSGHRLFSYHLYTAIFVIQLSITNHSITT
jgi:hypothetical protein